MNKNILLETRKYLSIKTNWTTNAFGRIELIKISTWLLWSNRVTCRCLIGSIMFFMGSKNKSIRQNPLEWFIINQKLVDLFHIYKNIHGPLLPESLYSGERTMAKTVMNFNDSCKHEELLEFLDWMIDHVE